MSTTNILDLNNRIDELEDALDALQAPNYARAVAISPNTSYSVTADGYIIAVRIYGNTAGTLITINNVAVMIFNPGGYADMGSCVYPVKNGDTVVTSNLDNSSKIYFAPVRR